MGHADVCLQSPSLQVMKSSVSRDTARNDVQITSNSVRLARGAGTPGGSRAARGQARGPLTAEGCFVPTNLLDGAAGVPCPLGGTYK